MLSTKTNTHNLFKPLLLLVWLLVQCALLFFNGIKTDQEALRIISLAENFVNSGHFGAKNFYLYLTEIFLVAVKIKLNIGYWFVVAVQLAVNLFALNYFYKFLQTYLASQKMAFVGSLLLLMCIPYQSYNGYIYTESLFFSLSIIYSCVLLQTKSFTAKRMALLLFLLLLLCVTRPTGIYFFATTVVYVYFKQWHLLSAIAKIILPLTAIVICLTAINFFVKGNSGYDVTGPFEEEHVICGVTTLNIEPATVMATDNSLLKLGKYLINHKQQVAKLMLLRSKAFWGLGRNYYSAAHNAYLFVFFYPLYFLIVAAAAKFWCRPSANTVYLLAVCCIYWLSVIFTCDDWGNRFFYVLVPFLISLSLLFFKKQNIQKD